MKFTLEDINNLELTDELKIEFNYELDKLCGLDSLPVVKVVDHGRLVAYAGAASARLTHYSTTKAYKKANTNRERALVAMEAKPRISPKVLTAWKKCAKKMSGFEKSLYGWPKEKRQI